MQRLKSVWARHEWWLIPVLLGVGYFLLQLGQISKYGVTWDEPLHRNWGKLFAAFWQTGDRQFLEMMPGHGIEYGPLYYFANYHLSEWLYATEAMRFVAANHVLNIFTASIGVVVVFLFARSIGGRRVGALATVLFVLYPPLVAHAHYNPKDIPLMVALLATSFVFLKALKKHSMKLLMLSAVLMGFSIAMKVSALLMAPVFALTYMFWLIGLSRQSSFKNVLRSQIVWIVAAIVICILSMYLFWPSAWGDLMLIPGAIKFFLSSTFWPGKVLFFGVEYGGAELPWYYTVFEYFAVTPLLTLIFFVVGAWILGRRFTKKEFRIEDIFLTFWIVFPLLVSMKPGLVRYDGMRQFFFVLPAIVTVAAIGLNQLLAVLHQRARKKHAQAVFMALVFLSLFSQLMTVHPYEGSYRNEVVRAMYPSHLDQSFQIEYWGASYKEGVEWLIDHAKPNAVICVPTAGILVTWYPWREDFTFDCNSTSTYVMFFTRYTDARAYQHLTDPVFAIRRMDSDLLKIYQL